ncbi:MAG TPA: hypothetical protein VFH43_07800, partial [Candidatus Kapabacteria bacterium]|nr:hypothetical protein [Candidatus Kapabacteria bacterium]
LSTDHPLDSVYSNNELRLRGSGKVVLSETSILGIELGYGMRTYLDPLSISSERGSPGPPWVVTVGSEFSQYSVGAWYQHFISEKLVIGGIASAAFAPELKAYVTSVDRGGVGLDPLLGIADEEYNYDLFSIAAFVNSNPIEEIEATLDLTYQHRAYGEVDLGTVRSRPGNQEIQELIASASNANRTENWIIASLGASRLFLFDEPLLSIFSGVGLDASLTFNAVSASVESYSYNSTSITVSAAAYF